MPHSAARAPKSASGHESGLEERQKNIKNEKLNQERMLDFEVFAGAACLLQNSQPIVWPNPMSSVGGNVCALPDGNLRRPHLPSPPKARSRRGEQNILDAPPAKPTILEAPPAKPTRQPRGQQRRRRRQTRDSGPPPGGAPHRPHARTCRNNISRSGGTDADALTHADARRPPHSDYLFKAHVLLIDTIYFMHTHSE